MYHYQDKEGFDKLLKRLNVHLNTAMKQLEEIGPLGLDDLADFKRAYRTFHQKKRTPEVLKHPHYRYWKTVDLLCPRLLETVIAAMGAEETKKKVDDWFKKYYMN